jgi:glycosyltransferase EpsD
MGACLSRLAARNRGAKIIYTAHGFHFFKGAPLLNWLVFYPIEKYLSKYTDGLVTINEEDYYLANQKFKMQEAVSY